MSDFSNTFDSDEQLATISTSITGAESATLTESDYTESGSGPYTYEAIYNGTTEGDYTFTLDTAEDSAGNDGASGESVVASLLDTFESNDIADWSNQDDYGASTASAFNGTYGMEYLGTNNTDFGNTILPITNNAYGYFSVWVQYSAFDQLAEINLGSYASDTTGTDGVRAGVDDGSNTTAGEVSYNDGSAWQGTGITLSTGQFYNLQYENIDYSAETYDITVEDSSGSNVGTFTGASFASTISQTEDIKLNNKSGSNIYYDDFVVVQ